MQLSSVYSPNLQLNQVKTIILISIYVVVNFLSQVILIFLLFLGMVMYANKDETKEK